MDFGKLKSRYVTISMSGAVLDEHIGLEADEDAEAWGGHLAETRPGDVLADGGFAVVALRRTVGMDDKVIHCWGAAAPVGIDLAAVRRAVDGDD
jgi:hypothetical protein